MMTAQEIAQLVHGHLEGDAQLQIMGVAGLDDAQPQQLSFFGNAKYKRALAATRASAVLVPRDSPARGDKTFIAVENPHLAFARVAQAFHPPKRHAPGISPKASVHPQATVDGSATVMDFAVVCAHATVGPGAVLFPSVYVGENAHIGAETVLHSHVVVADFCRVGARCLVHSNAVIGADGFGFAFDASIPAHIKIPQAGIVRIEDDVEIGACSCVDRATTGETVVGRGSKIDNLVQIAHNCVVGPFSILCAQVGLSGTSQLGQGVMLGGQAGVAGHLRIGDLAKIGAQAGVMSDVEPGATLHGAPAMDSRDFMRSTAVFMKLPELQRELRDLKKRLEELEHGRKP